jgi:hemerythrin-like domain-containing protein
MSRYNIFNQVHKGLRALLLETALRLQQTDFDTDEAEIVVQQLQGLIDLFDRHAHTEDTFVFPAIAAGYPAVIAEFEQEHKEDHELGLHLRGLLTAFTHAVSSAEKTAIGSSLRQSFTDFMVFNLRHMAKEENIINKALWKLYTDTELHGITQQIVASISPEAMAVYSNCMMRGLSNNEITVWLKEVKNNAPDVVFQSLMYTAEVQLSSLRWQQVQEAITEGAMLA